MSIKLGNGYHYITTPGIGNVSLSLYVTDGKIETVNIHQKDNNDLETVLFTPQNVKTKKNTHKQTTKHDGRTISKDNVVILTHEKVA